MVTTVVVGPGDHLARLCARLGVSRDRVWDHPDNAALRDAGRTPEILAPGDELVIPDREPSFFTVETDAKHRFVVRRQPLMLRCRLLDPRGEALAETEVEVDVDGQIESMMTDADGILEITIRPDTLRVLLTVGDHVFEVSVGALDPLETDAGVFARLQALGYGAGELEVADPQDLRFAISLLQHDLGVPPTGELDDALRASLREAFGS